MTKPKRGRFLSAEDVAYIRANVKTMGVRPLARQLGVSASTVCRANQGYTWSFEHGPKTAIVAMIDDLKAEVAGLRAENATLRRQLALSREHYRARLADVQREARECRFWRAGPPAAGSSAG